MSNQTKTEKIKLGYTTTRGDDMGSIWSDEKPRILTDRKELPKTAEVVIIGGGMAGLLCSFGRKTKKTQRQQLSGKRVEKNIS